MNEENANKKQIELSEHALEEVIISRMQPSRRTMLHSLGTVALPLIYCVEAKSAPRSQLRRFGIPHPSF